MLLGLGHLSVNKILFGGRKLNQSHSFILGQCFPVPFQSWLVAAVGGIGNVEIGEKCFFSLNCFLGRLFGGKGKEEIEEKLFF